MRPRSGTGNARRTFERWIGRARLGLVACAVVMLSAGCVESEPGLSRFTVITSGQHELVAGDSLEGNLMLLGGHMTIQDGARVDGALVMVSGTVNLAGSIAGDIALVNGALTLAPTARVGGSVDVAGGVLDRAPGATISGPVRTGSDVQPLGPPPQAPSLAERAWRGLVGTAVLALLAYTLVRLCPEQLSRVARASVEEAAVAGAVGALTGIVVPALLLLMALTILLIPIAFAGVLTLVGLVVYGWVGMALAIGRLATARTSRCPRPAVTAAIGMIILMLIANAFGAVPVVGGLVTAGALAVALGSALLTGLGTRVYASPPGD